MTSRYRTYIPTNIGEILELLALMMFASPTFKDKLGDFPDRNIDTVFFALNEGLTNVRSQLGEDRYRVLLALSDKMRTHFEADPKDETEDSLAGREIISDMEEILTRAES
jgi:hypothetical protein